MMLYIIAHEKMNECIVDANGCAVFMPSRKDGESFLDNNKRPEHWVVRSVEEHQRIVDAEPVPFEEELMEVSVLSIDNGMLQLDANSVESLRDLIGGHIIVFVDDLRKRFGNVKQGDTIRLVNYAVGLSVPCRILRAEDQEVYVCHTDLYEQHLKETTNAS